MKCEATSGLECLPCELDAEFIVGVIRDCGCPAENRRFCALELEWPTPSTRCRHCKQVGTTRLTEPVRIRQAS